MRITDLSIPRTSIVWIRGWIDRGYMYAWQGLAKQAITGTYEIPSISKKRVIRASVDIRHSHIKRLMAPPGISYVSPP
jgi:hypothetical protein